MLILELLRAETAECGVGSASAVDLIDEAWKVARGCQGFCVRGHSDGDGGRI